MDINTSFKYRPLSNDTLVKVLQVLAKRKNNSDIIRGQIKEMIPSKNHAVIVVGDYPNVGLRKIVHFNVVLEQEDIQSVLKDRVLILPRTKLLSDVVWNVDLCKVLRTEFGLRFSSEDFLPVRVNPTSEEIILTFVPHHPFYYGSVTVRLTSSEFPVNVENVKDDNEAGQPINIRLTSSEADLLSFLSVGDRLPFHIAEYIASKSNKVTYSTVKSLNNLKDGLIVDKASDFIRICPECEYNSGLATDVILQF